MGCCKTENTFLEKKAFYICLFVDTKCVVPGDPILKKSEHVAPFNTYIHFVVFYV
jgi:hypothetical protein